MNTRRARLQKELNTTQYRPCDATNILKQDLRAPQLCFLVIDNAYVRRISKWMLNNLLPDLLPEKCE
jgi:hypothetical protein